MKREYSFNQMSQVQQNQLHSNSRVGSHMYITGHKQPTDTWTDKRVEEIKKKYDTPSHRKNQSNHGPNERVRDHYADNNASNIYSSSYRNALRDSTMFSNHLRREGGLKANTSVTNFKEEEDLQRSKYLQLEEEPRFTYDAKQNENGSFMEKFTNIKNSMKIQQKPIAKEVSKYREYPSSKIVPRVQHIDEINLKIKKILECLHDDNAPKYEQNKEMQSSFLKGSTFNRSGNQLEETKILSRQKFTHGRQNDTGKESIIHQERYSLSPQAHNQSSTKWRLEDKYNEMKRSSFLNNSLVKKTAEKGDDSTDSWFEQPLKIRESRNNRTRSCLGAFKNEDLKLNSGKKLDDQISKINVRIKQFEEEKKKLNIDFKPYKYEMKYNRSTSNLGDHRYQRTDKPPKPTNKQSSISPSFHRVPQKLRTQADQDYQKYNFDGRKSLQISFEHKPISRINSSSFNIKAKQRFECNGERQDAVESEERLPKFKQIEPEVQNPEPSHIEEELKLKTQQGIEERKRKLLQTATVTFSRETKRLIQNLFEQVKLDEDLRNAKIWYRDLFDHDKQYNLRSELQKNGLETSECQFEVTEEEDNPFYSVRESQQSYNCLVNRWIKAENYWKSHIAGQFNLKEFQVEKFSVEKVDLQRKGFFSVEDLVRFINMETGTFYRNRDLILVFRRMTDSNRLQWSEFLAILDRSQ